jgi:hypothetical protein
MVALVAVAFFTVGWYLLPKPRIDQSSLDAIGLKENNPQLDISIHEAFEAVEKLNRSKAPG